MGNLNKFFLCGAFLYGSAVSFGADYVLIGKEGAKIFDEPNAKGYVTLNQKNEEVSPSIGMVFRTLESKNGWYVIEYSSGLRGYLSEQMTVSASKTPEEGIYEVANHPGQKIEVGKSGNNWNALANGNTYVGICEENVVVFFDKEKKITYSLVVIGDNHVAMCYDNSITNFF